VTDACFDERHNLFLHRLKRKMRSPRTTLVTLLACLAFPSGAEAVVGGTEAPPGAYPWMSALVDAPLADAGEGQFCGATLIAPTMALTAAHCVEEASARDVHLVIGRHRLSERAVGQRIPVAAIASHPQVDLENIRNDVALLRLASPAAGAPLRLVAAGDEGFWTPGATARAIGWGQLHDGRPYVPDPLFQTDVPIVADAACALAYGRFFDSRSMICAGGGTPPGPVPDTCNGDSGGPLMVQNATGEWLHVGATSWGDECGAPRFPGVYSRTFPLLSFITSPSPIFRPSNEVLPTVRGVPKPGQTLACHPGRWSGSPGTFTYEWVRIPPDDPGAPFPGPPRTRPNPVNGEPASGFYTPIEGATNPTYTVAETDAENRLSCVVTGRNQGGSSYAQAPAVGPVALDPPAPPPPSRKRGDRFAPRALTVGSRCYRKRVQRDRFVRRCQVVLRVTDRRPSKGIAGVHATLVPRGPGRARTMKAKRLGRRLWLVRTPALKPGRYALLAIAVDRAGNVQAKPQRVLLRTP
jgi:hypothetical protein